MKFYPEQHKCMFGPERLALTEASTKAGKTTVALAWLYDQAMRVDLARYPTGEVWWVAPVFPQARIAFNRLTAALTRAGDRHFQANRSRLTVSWPDGHRISFKSGHNPDHLFGENVLAAIIDEASRVQEASIVAVRSTLTATRGPWRLIGNVRGVGNYFYRLCRQAEAGQLGDATHHRINALTASAYAADYPGLPTPEEVEEARALLPEPVFRELYLADPSGEDTNPFGLRAIGACTVEDLSPEPVVAFGVDVARDVDWTVIIGLDADGNCAHFARFQTNWMDTARRIADTVGDTPTYVDATGAGSPLVEHIRDLGAWVDPYVFTQPSKMKLMEHLGLAIHGQTVAYPEEVADELNVLEYRYTRNGVSYEAAAGYHDDCVMALGLALAKLRSTGFQLGIALGALCCLYLQNAY